MRGFCRKNIITVLIIIIISGFFSCAKYEESEAGNTNFPEYTEQPFYESSQSITGGDGLTGLNLADIKLEDLEEDVSVITLSFMDCSGALLADQQVSAGVPYFEVTRIDGVDRMVIKLDGVTAWTYKIYEDEIQNNKVVKGVLKQEPISGSSFYLYISTNDDYRYNVETKENKIIITCRHIDEAESYKYYIKINSFLEYENGDFITYDFYPCLSRDGANGVLLSSAFETLEDAQEFLGTIQDEITKHVAEEDISVIYLGNNELPEYDYENQLEQIINNPIGVNGENYIVGEPLITEGRFLAWNDGGNEFVYAKPITILSSQQGDAYSYEEIWIRTNDGDVRLTDQQFTSVLSAAYSYDGRYIAFINQSDETRMLLIADKNTGNLYVPADDGFGIDTSSFVWSNNENKLYAITGERDSKQLLCYVLKTLGDPEVCAVTEEKYMESSLYMFDENIYYLKVDETTQITSIYKSDAETGHAVKYLQGNSFMLSPDGGSILVNDMQFDNAQEYLFYIFDSTSGVKYIIETGKMIMDYTWSKNGERVYYTVYKNAGWEEEYPLELYYYDTRLMKSFYVMDMITGALYTAHEDGSVLIMSIFQLQDKQITITYQVK